MVIDMKLIWSFDIDIFSHDSHGLINFAIMFFKELFLLDDGPVKKVSASNGCG